jgi:transglutaminase-like putative cysteine protease
LQGMAVVSGIPAAACICVASLNGAFAAGAFDPAGEYHVVSIPGPIAEATLDVHIHAPSYFAAEWVVVVPTPPAHPGQTDVVHELWLNDRMSGAAPSTEDSPLSRPIRVMRVPGSGDFHSLSFQSRYRVRLHRRHLAPGKTPTAPAELTRAEREFYLQSTPTVDFKNPGFRALVREKNWLRDRQESEWAFAYRVFRSIVDEGKYAPGGDQDRQPQRVGRTLSSDCGGFSLLYVAVLRNAGIPARTLWGRWAKNQEDDNAQFHVKAEWFATGAGWVPVELAGAITSPGIEKDELFGNDNGGFITLHVDTDLKINTIHYGHKDIGWRQGSLFWAKGFGSLDDHTFSEIWKVRLVDQPTPEKPLGNRE